MNKSVYEKYKNEIVLAKCFIHYFGVELKQKNIGTNTFYKHNRVVYKDKEGNV